jgi:hypothetical protein
MADQAIDAGLLPFVTINAAVHREIVNHREGLLLLLYLPVAFLARDFLCDVPLVGENDVLGKRCVQPLPPYFFLIRKVTVKFRFFFFLLNILVGLVARVAQLGIRISSDRILLVELMAVVTFNILFLMPWMIEQDGLFNEHGACGNGGCRRKVYEYGKQNDHPQNDHASLPHNLLPMW